MMKLNKILLVGAFATSPSVYTYTDSFYNALLSLGYHVEKFNNRARFFPLEYLNQKICNRTLIKKVAAYKPDLVFLLKAENIFASTIQIIKDRYGCKLINFYTDNPFTVWNGNSNTHVLQSLPLYDCFMSWSSMLTPALLSAGSKHSCMFPFAYDQQIFNTTEHNTDIAQQFDVCFIGTWEPAREAWLTKIIEQLPGVSLAIWGNQWQEQCHNTALKKFLWGPAIYGSSMIQAFRASKIVLNFIRTQNMTAHNMRTFEVPASGSFLLTERTAQQAEVLFKEHESIACFQTPEELIEKITFYLQHSDVRNAITKKGCERVTDYQLIKQLQVYFENCNSLNP